MDPGGAEVFLPRPIAGAVATRDLLERLDADYRRDDAQPAASPSYHRDLAVWQAGVVDESREVSCAESVRNAATFRRVKVKKRPGKSLTSSLSGDVVESFYFHRH